MRKVTSAVIVVCGVFCFAAAWSLPVECTGLIWVFLATTGLGAIGVGLAFWPYPNESGKF